jgi:hypothetical protein
MPYLRSYVSGPAYDWRYFDLSPQIQAFSNTTVRYISKTIFVDCLDRIPLLDRLIQLASLARFRWCSAISSCWFYIQFFSFWGMQHWGLSIGARRPARGRKCPKVFARGEQEKNIKQRNLASLETLTYTTAGGSIWASYITERLAIHR